MGKGDLGHPETRGTVGPGSGVDSLTEKRELESVLATLLIPKASRGIPPLRLEIPVRSVIPWKHVFPTRLGNLPFLRRRKVGKEGQDQ
jgi:hypothetical protein